MNERIQKLLGFYHANSKDQFIIHALALEYKKEGDFQEAIRYFQQNIEIDENYVATYYHLGKLYESLDNEKDAIAIYEKGMQIAQSINDRHALSELRSAYDELTM
jgi:tetratricopeptide (TPR) repeat protein